MLLPVQWFHPVPAELQGAAGGIPRSRVAASETCPLFSSTLCPESLAVGIRSVAGFLFYFLSQVFAARGKSRQGCRSVGQMLCGCVGRK